jgi:CHAT domain-containing protein
MVTDPQTAVAAPPEVTVLAPGQPLQRTLAGAETHRYQINLQQGQCAEVEVEQLGIDVAVQLMGNDQSPTVEGDDEIGRKGTEKLAIVADHDGVYMLAIKSRLKLASGAYRIRVVEVRPATDLDRSLDQIRQLHTKVRNLSAVDKYNEALPIAEQTLTLAQQALGNDDAYVALLRADVADIYEGLGRRQQARQVFEPAWRVLVAKLGADNPQTLSVKSRLGDACEELEDFPAADQLLSEVLTSEEKTLGPNDPLVAETLWPLGKLHMDRGDMATAEHEFLRGIEILDQAGLTDGRQYGQFLNGLGVIYINEKNSSKARFYLERALAFREKVFGPDSMPVSSTLNNLGVVAKNSNDWAAAEKYYGRALELVGKHMGTASPDYASRLGNLSRVYRAEGDYRKALELDLRALNILEKNQDWGDTRRNELISVSQSYAALGDFDNANKFEAQAESELEKVISLNMVVGSERQKLTYSSSLYVAQETEITVSLNLQLEPDNSQAAALAATVLLQRKGRVLDAETDTLGALRKHSDPRDQVLLDEFKEATTQLAHATLQGSRGKSSEELRKELHDLQTKKEDLENLISRHNERFRAELQSVTLQAVQSSIPADSALVEFVTYHPADPKAQTYNQHYGKPRYGAYVLHSVGAPRGIDLGDAKEIDDAVENFRSALRDPERTDVRQLAGALADKVFRPLQGFLANDKHLLVSPDGQLDLVPFEALLDDQGRFLVERFSLTYLTTGRDLLRMQSPRPHGSAPVIVADPFFGEPERTLVAKAGASPVKLANTRNARRSVTTGVDYSNLYFAPLSGTRAEAESISGLLPEVRLLTGKQASEATLEQLKAPRILHIATHGFFLQDTGLAADASTGKNVSQGRVAADLENPLLRSGLALSGANFVKDGKSEGILTALEASNLDLWGTKLVTLSACDTGVGEVKNGEGVYGLRRSFFLAGAETLVMSLWPVSDRVTREMMTAYYTGLKQGLGRGEALRQAELEMMKRKDRGHPFYWASFIQSGEWANLDGQR